MLTVCMRILRSIKTFMYKFHYNHIKDSYGRKAKVLFTDTDGLVYESETNDVYEDFYRSKKMFDFSKYPESLVLRFNK